MDTVAPIRDEDLTIGEIMVRRVIQARKAGFGIADPMPLISEIDRAINASPQDESFGEFIGAAWDDAEAIVDRAFPQFAEPRDPYEVYGTPEHEAWLVEMERNEGW